MNLTDHFALRFIDEPIRLPRPMPSVTFVQPLDLNRDGETDFLVATDNYGSGPDDYPGYLLIGDGAGGFSIGGRLPNRFVPRDVAVADFNGDGMDDVYVAYTGPDTQPAPGERDVLMLSGGGRWSAARVPSPSNAFSHSATAGDFDRDGDPDIYVQTNGNQRNAQPYFLLNDGDGRFTLDRTRLPDSLATQNDSRSFKRQHWAEFIDVDGDRDLDLVTGKQEQPGTRPPRESRVYFNERGRFDDANSAVLPDHPRLRNAQEMIGIYGVDLDGDRDVEIVTLSQGRRANGYTPEFALQVFSVKPGGRVVEESQRWFGGSGGYFPGTGATPYFLDFQDVNGDGRVDIVGYLHGGGGDSRDAPAIFFNGGRGVFEIAKVVEIESDQTFLFGTGTASGRLEGGLAWFAFGADENGDLAYTIVEEVAPLPQFPPRIPGEPRPNGTPGDDNISGTRGADTLSGRGGDDRLSGLGGGDRLKGGGGADTLIGGGGKDTLLGGGGNDRLSGGGGADDLRGGGGADALRGQGGRDVLNGGGGNDRLAGGGGADRFVFAGRFGDDAIQDFETRGRGEKIDLSAVGSIASFRDLRQNHLSEAGGDAIIEDGRGGSITLIGVDAAALSANDFIF